MADSIGSFGPTPNPYGANGVPADVLDQFHTEIQAITAAIEAQTNLLPAKIAAAQQEVLDVYKNAGKPSRPTSAELPGAGPSESASSGGSGKVGPEATPPAPPGIDPDFARKLQAAMYKPSRGRQGGQFPSTQSQDYDEGELGIFGEAGQTSSGPGSSASTGGGGQTGTWLDQVPAKNNVLQLPRMEGAKITPADQLQYLASASAGFANKKRAAIQSQMTALEQSGGAWETDGEGNVLTDPDTGYKIPTQDYSDYTDRLSSGDMGGGRWGSVSNTLTKGAAGYTQGKYIMGSLKSILDPINGTRALGYETGAQGGSPGFLGLRSPFDSASLHGLGQDFSKWGFALSNNVTPGQASAIYNNLYSQGWYGGQATNEMRQAGAQIMQSNPLIGSDPQTYSMMDQATRLGATSLNTFVATMKSVPMAAQSAHVSIAQMMSDMDAMGQYNQTIGGTYGQGMQKAQTWANVTGLDPGVEQQMMQNPLVQGMTFMGTGLMPWEQGLASGGQQIQGIMSAVGMMKNMINPASTLRTEIGNTGFYNTVSKNQQQSALAAQLLGISPAQFNNLVHNQHGIEVGANISDEARSYAGSVQALIRRNTPQSLSEMRDVLNGTGKGTWGQLQGNLREARDSEGHRIFSASDLKQLNQIGDQPAGHWQQVDSGRGAGLSGQYRKWIPNSGDTAANIARKRQTLIKKDIAQDTQKYGGTSGAGGNGPQVTVELGPAAKKFFHLNDPNAQQKANTNAGTSSVNVNSWATGPTYGPTPGIATAGSSQIVSGYGSGDESSDSGYDTGGF